MEGKKKLLLKKESVRRLAVPETNLRPTTCNPSDPPSGPGSGSRGIGAIGGEDRHRRR